MAEAINELECRIGRDIQDRIHTEIHHRLDLIYVLLCRSHGDARQVLDAIGRQVDTWCAGNGVGVGVIKMNEVDGYSEITKNRRRIRN